MYTEIYNVNNHGKWRESKYRHTQMKKIWREGAGNLLQLISVKVMERQRVLVGGLYNRSIISDPSHIVTHRHSSSWQLHKLINHTIGNRRRTFGF